MGSSFSCQQYKPTPQSRCWVNALLNEGGAPQSSWSGVSCQSGEIFWPTFVFHCYLDLKAGCLVNPPLPRDCWRKSSLTVHSHPPLSHSSFPGLQAWSVVWVTGQCWAGRLPICSKIIIPASSSIFSLPGGLFSCRSLLRPGLCSWVTGLRSQLWLCMAAARLGADDWPSISVSSSVIHR